MVEADKDFNVISRFARGYEVVAAYIADSEAESKLNRYYYYTVDEQQLYKRPNIDIIQLIL
ncbi:hypothetical protein [Clostridium sp. LS]|uniref:hypothetical protein n=1 Tax=Clostridium sp. LS TaxID=1352601 RepID=UPI0002ECD250|nr:hypothetical protein [Clostridium sp. LS]